MKYSILYIFFIYLSVFCVVSCANPGSGPDGGPFDETPPRIVGMTQPEHAGRAGSRGTKITIKFSENINLDNASENVIVSPPQIEQPEISAYGKRVTVQLHDTIRPQTTYTIDFADAIKDATEGNPLGSFTYMFSTSETIDTMEVSGHVLRADDLEPIKGILVGLYPALSPDSIFRYQPLTRVARTDGNGHFCIKGVADGEYRVVCLQDIDQDFKFSLKNEMIGWYRENIKTSSFPDIRLDTCWVDPTRWDSIRAIPYTHYKPDDVIVLGFVEDNQPRHKIKHNREQLNRFNIFLSAPSTSEPIVEGINFDASCLSLEHSVGYDTLCYWICDTTLVNTDSLYIKFSYDESDDSTGIRVWRTDTLELFPKIPLAKRLKQKADEQEKWEKALEKRHKRGDYSQEIPPIPVLRLEGVPHNRLTPMDNIVLRFKEPIDSISLNGFHLLLKVDTTLTEASFEMYPLPMDKRSYELRAEWRPEQNYQLKIDSACVRSIYGLCNNEEQFNISVQKLEEFGTIFLTIPESDNTTIVQLLDRSGKVVRELPVENGRATFYYVLPGTYFYRCYFDRNGDKRWTPGSFDKLEQSEEVFYSPVQLDVKANFDYDQTWNLYELPLTEQKPRTMIKQKEEKKQKQSAHEKNIKRLQDKRK